MTKQKFLINLNSIRANRGNSHAVFGVKDGTGNKSPLNVIPGMHISFQQGKPLTTQRDHHPTKQRSIVCTLELLGGDAFNLT